MVLKTFNEVADYNKLDSVTKNRYVDYMKTRWLESEEQKCKDGYATEWALRFKNKIEYQKSDELGIYILNNIIDKKSSSKDKISIKKIKEIK